MTQSDQKKSLWLDLLQCILSYLVGLVTGLAPIFVFAIMMLLMAAALPTKQWHFIANPLYMLSLPACAVVGIAGLILVPTLWKKNPWLCAGMVTTLILQILISPGVLMAWLMASDGIH
jgi:hypothetical protein